MSLKAFHIVFISASILLSAFVGVWGLREYTATGSALALIMGIFFLVMGGGLVVYGLRALTKLREV